MGVTDHGASEIEFTFYRMDRAGMRELADLWKPGVPVAENEAYIRRARELNAELETALVTQYDASRHDTTSE